MSSRTLQLLTFFIQIQNNIYNLYKKVYNIDGQYNQKIRTSAKVMMVQSEKKIEQYKELIEFAMGTDMDITMEGYDIIFELLQKRAATIKESGVSDYISVILFAYNNANDLINIVSVAIERIDSLKDERPHLREALSRILTIETKDAKALKHILDTHQAS